MKTEDKIVWIYKCGTDWKYCKDGFCGRYNQLKEDHEHPAVEISKEWFEVTGREWKTDAIRKRFEKLIVTKSHTCDLYGNIEDTDSECKSDDPEKQYNEAMARAVSVITELKCIRSKLPGQKEALWVVLEWIEKRLRIKPRRTK